MTNGNNSGNGKIHFYTKGYGPYQEWVFYLYNYHISSSSMQSAHRSALDSVIVPILKWQAERYGTYQGVDIEGRHSNTGALTYNRALADRRARVVRDYIAGYKIPLKGMVYTPLHAHRELDGLGRDKDIYNSKGELGELRAVMVTIGCMGNQLSDLPVIIPASWREV